MIICPLVPEVARASRRAVAVSLTRASQTKSIKVSAEALASGSDPALPPLMNPAMLEASDDLTNLSHLNEPAGVYNQRRIGASRLVLLDFDLT